MTKEKELTIVQGAVVEAMAAEGVTSITPGVLDADDDLTVWKDTTVGQFIPGGNESLVGEYHIGTDGSVDQVSFEGG